MEGGKMRRCWVCLLLVAVTGFIWCIWYTPMVLIDMKPVILSSKINSSFKYGHHKQVEFVGNAEDDYHLQTSNQASASNMVVFHHIGNTNITQTGLIQALDNLVDKFCPLKWRNITVLLTSNLTLSDPRRIFRSAVSRLCPAFNKTVLLVSRAVTVSSSSYPRKLWHDFAFDAYLKGVGMFLITSTHHRCSVDINAFIRGCHTHGAAISSSGDICMTVSHYEALGCIFPININIEDIAQFIPSRNNPISGTAIRLWIPWLVCLYGIQAAVDFNIDVNCNATGFVHTLSEHRHQLDRWSKYRNDISRNGTKVISFSLFGSGRKYIFGAVRNAILTHIYYPGWQMRIYTNKALGTLTSKLESLGVDIRNTSGSNISPLMWRFLVADDPSVDVFIIRDIDSRFTKREVFLVEDWLQSGRTFHCIRDHPAHRIAVMAGMWGARRAPFAAILKQPIQKLITGNNDQAFLGTHVWPIVLNDTYCHDAFHCRKYPASHPLPVARVGTEHVGQVFDDYDLPRIKDIRYLANITRETACSPLPIKL